MIVKELCAFFLLEENMGIRSLSRKIISLLLVSALLFGALVILAYAADAESLGNFAASVTQIERKSKLKDKIKWRNEAEKYLAAYIASGGSVTDADISASYERFIEQKEEIEEKIGFCDEFVSTVTEFLSSEELTYTEISSYTTVADALLDKIDKDYVGVKLDEYNNLKGEIQEKTDACDVYINYAKAAADAKTYADISANYDSALLAKKNVEYEDYPGLSEADENLDEAIKVMAAKRLDSMDFVAAVENIPKAKSIPAGIAAARAVLESKSIDLTEEKASGALTTLELHERSYTRKVNQANALVDKINSFIFGLMF